ncbi:MAG: hypothetical protein PW789_19375 [Edaphobacter sp.]|uniref:hypothetical protein n=1 Tax=Edaphobacter sp. TaxID=1934404 RepID=UPI00239FB2C5|nr:hypothetical protein [Edaphobacter sp.]MDE1178742.1 hypothetical protein [Edaphobacter sp.]
MAQLLVKIEFEGKPKDESYLVLDRFMSSRFWERIKRPGTSASDIAHAMYRASTLGDRPNLAIMANELKRSIEYRVGEKARILMVQSQNWIETS